MLLLVLPFTFVSFKGFMNKYLPPHCCPVVSLYFLEVIWTPNFGGNLFTVRISTAGCLKLDCDFTELFWQSGGGAGGSSERSFNSALRLPWRLLKQSWTERGHFNTDIQLLLMRAVKCMDGRGIGDGTHFLWIAVPEIFALQCRFSFGALCFCG